MAEFISKRDQDFLREKFQKELSGEVTIKLFTQRETLLTIPGVECLYCRETNQLMQEISELSDKIRLEIYDFVADEDKAREYKVDKIPAIIIQGPDGSPLRFFGIPSGYEFSTIIEDILDVSNGAIHLSKETQETIAELDTEVHIQVFVTPT